MDKDKNEEKKGFQAGGIFYITSRTREVSFWPSLVDCSLSVQNYPYVQWVLHRQNRTDLRIPKWYNTWYLGQKMPP